MINIRHVILDRDGVLNQETPGGFVRTPDEWIWLPRVLDALAALSKAGILLSIASNQSCVGRGIIDALTLDQIHDRLRQEAVGRGIEFAGIYYCPHAPDAGCNCRKPKPGLIQDAIHKSGIARSETVFIGDAESDLIAGQSAGVNSWLVRTGKGSDTEVKLKENNIKGVDSNKVCVFDDLYDACLTILSRE